MEEKLAQVYIAVEMPAPSWNSFLAIIIHENTTEKP